MKKAIVAVMFLFVVMGAGADKPAEVKQEVTKVAALPTQADWKAATTKASQLDADGKFVDAATTYAEAAAIAVLIGDSYADVRKAWALNDAAYELIKEHKKDQKGASAVDLITKAKKLLDETAKIDKADAECVKCVNSNLDYVNDWMKILNIVIVEPAVKK